MTYNVSNFYVAETKLAQTNLRNLIGDLALDESLTSREIINTKLREILDDATDKWGTKVTRVELQRRGRGGTLRIAFNSEAELQRLFDLLVRRGRGR